MNRVLQARGLAKHYANDAVFTGIDLTLRAGEAVVLLGPSGSGKTTLLSVLAGLLRPDAGSLWVCGEHVPFHDPAALVELRRTRLGFVFQHAQLLPFLGVEDNLTIIAENAGLTRVHACARANELIEQLELTPHRQKRPGQLSGGQRQRVAIARALLHRPAIVLADEPTAALDWRHGSGVIDLLLERTRAANAALLVVTHDTRLVPRFDRVLRMSEGRLQEAVAGEVLQHA